MIFARPGGFRWPRPGGRAENPWVLSLRGRRLGARVSATAVALALAGTAVVLNGQASTDAALEAAAGGQPATTQPTSATITIKPATFGGKFVPKTVSLATGGTLKVVNTTGLTHSFTSVAVGNDGRPLFDVRLTAGTTKTIGAVSSLPDGVYGFYCRFHPSMTGTLTIGAGGPVTNAPRFEQPLVQPPR